MRELYVIAHNIRSTFNVGALLRTAEGLGIKKVFFTGYTPYPAVPNDTRLPHEAQKLTKQINKTALGAEAMVPIEVHSDIIRLFKELQSAGIEIIALEQSKNATPLTSFNAPDRLAILLGEEVKGIEPELLNKIQTHIVIPMHGKKESFNVASAAAMALHELRFH